MNTDFSMFNFAVLFPANHCGSLQKYSKLGWLVKTEKAAPEQCFAVPFRGC
jgi:hypothetical protein